MKSPGREPWGKELSPYWSAEGPTQIVWDHGLKAYAVLKDSDLLGFVNPGFR